MNFLLFLLFLDGNFVYEVSEKSIQDAVTQLFQTSFERIGREWF